MWPALSHFYGVHPWDVDRLTYAELQHYKRSTERQLAEIEKANKQRGR